MTRNTCWWIASLWILGGCAGFGGVAVLESAPAPCAYVGTFVETHDPGRLTPLILAPYGDVTGCRRRIAERAAAAGATHLVLHYDFPTSAAASGFRCVGAGLYRTDVDAVY